MNFSESVGVKNYFSTSYEQWQNGLAGAAVDSLMMVSRTIMAGIIISAAESGLGGWFGFKSVVAACDASNATYKERISTTHWRRMYGEMRDVSWFCAFGYMA
jgi:hypothetical protein